MNKSETYINPVALIFISVLFLLSFAEMQDNSNFLRSVSDQSVSGCQSKSFLVSKSLYHFDSLNFGIDTQDHSANSADVTNCFATNFGILSGNGKSIIKPDFASPLVSKISLLSSQLFEENIAIPPKSA